MNYALIRDGAVARYPYDLANLRRDNPEADFADDYDLGDDGDYGVVPVAEAPQPELSEGQTLDEDLPVLIDGVWTRNWIVHDWLEIGPDGLFARLHDDGSITYPYTARDVRRDFGIAARAGTIRQMDGEWGVVAVEPVDMPQVGPGQLAANLPDADGIEEYAPGLWRQVWTVRERSAEELADAKVAARAAVSAKLAEQFAGGFTPSAGALAGKTLQTRDIEDRTNWLTSQAAYSAAVAAGQGAVEGAVFRTADNETVTTSYADGLAVLLAMAAWGKALMGHSWALKDQIAAAATFADLETIDIETGWQA